MAQWYMVRALTSQQCGLGLIPRLSIIKITWLELCWSQSSFPCSSKPDIFYKFQFDPESDGHRFVSHNGLLSVTLVKESQFVYLFYLLLVFASVPKVDCTVLEPYWVQIIYKYWYMYAP